MSIVSLVDAAASYRDAPTGVHELQVLMAGDRPGGGAGNAVSSDILLAALGQVATVDLLVHRMSVRPSLWVDSGVASQSVLTIGTQPAIVHGEGLAAGWMHRRRLGRWRCAWAVTSRYASALYACRVPYIIWEATTGRDELNAISLRSVRRNGNGSGLGAAVHHVLSPLDRLLERNIYRNATRLFAMGEYSRSLMLSHSDIPAERVELLLSPPSLAFLQAIAGRSRADYSPPRRSAPRLLFVGRVADPRKNADLLLDAFRLIRTALPQATLTIVGRHTPRWRDTSGAVRSDSGIVLTGEVDVGALADAYLNHDVLIVSSQQEGYGLVVAEALHAGLPVVSTRCGGPEAIIRDSGGGILVTHTPRALGDAVLALLAEQARWESCARGGIAFARRELSFDRFVSRVSDITRSVGRAAPRPVPAPA